MNPPSVSLPATLVAPNAGHAFGGIWRLTARRFLAPRQLLPLPFVLALLAILAGAVVRDGNAKVFHSWSTEFYLAFLVPVLAFLSGGGAFRDEIKAGAVDYVLTRPIRRPLFLVFKFLAHQACFQLLCLSGLAVVAGVGVFRHIPDVGSVIPALLLGQVLLIAAFSAFGFLCAVLTSRYLVVGLCYGVVIEAGVGNTPMQINRLSMTHQVRALVERLIALAPPPPAAPEPAVWTTVGLALVFAAVMVAVAAAVFSFQELAGARPTDA
jgi:ABC-2 type transport system permease protein